MPNPAIISAAALLALAGSLSASPLTLEPLVLVGTSFGDVPGVVSQTTSLSSIKNSGEWVTRVLGNDSEGSFLGIYVIAYDGIRYDPFTPVPFDETYSYTTPVRSPLYSSINNQGEIATTYRGVVTDVDGNALPGQRTMIAVDGSPILRTGDTTPFGGTYGDFGSTRHILNDGGHLLANFDLIFNPFSTFETVIEFSPSESGYDQTVRSTTGMPLNDGYSIRDGSSAAWRSFDFNNEGDTIFGVTVTESDLTARAAIVVNGTIQRMSGTLKTFSDGQLSLATMPVAINGTAEFAYWGLASSSAWAGAREAVLRNNDDIVWIDDGSDPLLADWTISSIANMAITNNGEVFWQPGEIQNLLGETVTALFRNVVVIATSDPNYLGDALFIEGGFSFDVSDNGQWVIFDTPHGIYRTLIPSPSTAALLVVGLLGSTRRRR